MVNYMIKVSENLQALPQLGAHYVRARKAVMVPAMEQAISLAFMKVQQLVPVGASGYARQSLRAAVRQTPAQTIGRVTSSMRRPNVYIFVLNAGRPAGKIPPSGDKLVGWVLAKGLTADRRQARRIAHAIARSISQKGIPSGRYFWGAWDKIQSEVNRIMVQATEDLTRELENDA